MQISLMLSWVIVSVAPDKAMLIKDDLRYICVKTYLLGTRCNRLIEVIPTSTHKICFTAKIAKIIF